MTQISETSVIHSTCHNRAAKDESRSAKFGLLQILRAFAATLVILVHSTGIIHENYQIELMGGYFEMGSAGVDFFFVLSGFLIFYIHSKDFGKPALLRSYVHKRWTRIYPLYWLVTLAILPAYFALPSLGQGDERNVFVILGSLTLLPMSRSPILVAGWTLRHEIMFYGLVAILIWRYQFATVCIIGCWVASVVVNAISSFDVNSHWDNPAVHTMLWPQNLEFVVGCLSAIALNSLGKYLDRRICLGLLSICIVAFMSIETIFGLLPIGSGKRVLCYGVVSFFIVVSAVRLDQTGGLGRSVNQSKAYSVLVFLGEASYSIYLLHGPVLSLLFKIEKSLNIGRCLGVVPVVWGVVIISLVAGCVCHVMIERPILVAARRMSRMPA